MELHILFNNFHYHPLSHHQYRQLTWDFSCRIGSHHLQDWGGQEDAWHRNYQEQHRLSGDILSHSPNQPMKRIQQCVKK